MPATQITVTAKYAKLDGTAAELFAGPLALPASTVGASQTR